MKSGIEAKIANAALKLAAKRDWSAVTLDHIAAAAKISRTNLVKFFPDKNRILPAIVARIDARAAMSVGKISPRATPHDRLFQVMMARFDILQEHRDAILAIYSECRRDPAIIGRIAAAQVQSMQKMLALANLTPKGLQEHVASFGLLAVYYRSLWCWQNDRTRDMAKTMAALDQGLRVAGRLAEIIFRGA